MRPQAPAGGAAKARGSVAARYQVYRQLRQGVFSLGFQTDCACAAINAFLHGAPAFTGGEVRIWNHNEQRLVASVQWRVEKNGFGTFVFRRINVFYDVSLERIARQIDGNEKRFSSISFFSGFGRR